MSLVTNIFGSLITGVRTINKKYATPQVEMTWFVKACLVALRLYLILLIGLMIYKFVITIQ